MKPHLPALSVIGIALCLFALSGRSPAAPDSNAEREVRELIDRQADDWNKGDLEAFLKGYWSSKDVVFQSGGDRMRGFDAVRDRYFKRYKADGKPMGKVTFSEIEVESLGPDSAYARGRWRLKMNDGDEPSGLFTLILRKLPEGWRIVHDHTSQATR